jgi:hypothetical protein
VCKFVCHYNNGSVSLHVITTMEVHGANNKVVQVRSSYGAFTPNVESVLSENLGGILGGTQC